MTPSILRSAGVCHSQSHHPQKCGKLIPGFLTLAASLAFCASAFSFNQDVYVWQRAWTDPLRSALTNEGRAFSNLVVLAAEVSWNHAEPKLIRVPIDYALVKKSGPSVGLALRIGLWSGSFDPKNPAAIYLGNVAQELLNEAKSSGLSVQEFQLDFDCAESKLEGYRTWVTFLKSKISPVPITITTLPSWLNQPAFSTLIKAADGYVLQVHSFERPRSAGEPFNLCDPWAARNAVERASQFNIPFRVALPTYGYLLAFDKPGRLIGLSAEGASPNWPAESQLREVRADPLEMAALAAQWRTNTPTHLQGIIWYRLPIKSDTLNWRWPTLRAILAGQSLRENIRVELRRVETGLTEVHLVNDGELDFSSRLAIEVRWSRDDETRLVAGDGLGDFEFVEARPSSIQLRTRTAAPWRLNAGEAATIGWLRLSKEREVQFEIKKF